MQQNITWNEDDIICDDNGISPQFAKQGAYFGSNLKHAPNNNGLMVIKLNMIKVTKTIRLKKVGLE